MAEKSLDPEIYGEEYVALVDRYRELGGEKFNVLNNDFDGAKIKMKAFIAEKEKEAKPKKTTTDSTADRKYAKRIWEGFRKTGDISDSVDFEKFYNSLDNDYVTKLFYAGRQRGGVTVDFITFRDALLNTPKVEVEGVDVMGPDGLKINQEDVIAPDFSVTSYENDLENITNKVNELKYRPILYTEETAPDPSEIGQIDVKATNDAIRAIQADAPDLLVANDNIDDRMSWEQLNETEARRYKELLDEYRANPNRDISKEEEGKDYLYEISEETQANRDKSDYEKRIEIYDKIIEERSQKLEQYNNGELDLSPEELYTISKINPKVETYLKDKLPDFNNLETREDLQDAYSKTVNDALTLDPRFANITSDIKNNINELSNDQWTEIGEKYDIFDEEGFKLAQEEYARWYNEQFQTRLNSNKKANDLFNAYGIGAARNFEKVSRNFERQLVDSEQEDRLRPDWIPEGSLMGQGLDLWDDLWSTKTANSLYEMAGFDVENQKQSVEDFDFFKSGFGGLLSQAQTGLGFILEAGDKLPDSISSNINKIQVAFGKKELERRAAVVDNLQKQITLGKLNKDMTLGEARKLDDSLDERLAWHDWTWTDNDNLGEYLTRKEKRENISEESIAFDLEEMAKANAELTKYIEVDTGSSIINPFGNNNLLGLMEALSMGVDQAPHMIPSVLGTTALAASGISLIGSGGTSAGGSVPLAAAGASLIALGAGYQGAMSYGNIFMDGVERQMEEKYGKKGFTTSQYIEALKDEAIGDEGSALLGGLAVTGTEFGSDILLSQIGGGVSKALGPTTKKMFSNTLGNYLMTAKLPQAFFNMKAQAGKEFLTEGFQSYLEQGFTNLAAGVNDPNTTFQTAFTENIDFDQIMTEAKGGWKMGHIFALGGVAKNSDLGVNLNQGNSIDSYIGPAKKLVDNLSFDSESPDFRLKDMILQDLINGAKENKKLTPEQIRSVEVQISNMRQNALDVPNNANVSQRTDLNSLLDEQKNLKNYIKKINNKSLTEYEVAREIEVDNEIKDIVRYIAPESFKPNKPSGGAAGAAMLEKNIADNRATIQKSSNNKLTFKDFTNQAAMDAYGKSKGLEIKYSGEQGTILQNTKTGQQEILINRDVSNKTGGTNVASHELGHAMVFETLRNNPEANAAFGEAVDRTLNDISKVDPMQLAESDYKQRLLRYNEGELDGQEKMMLLGDALKNGDITIDPGVLQRIRNFINKTLQDLGIQKISFNRDADVIAFLENLTDSIEKNKLNPAQETMLAEGAEVNLATEVDADVSAAQQIALASKASLNNIDELATEYQNDPASADIETLVKQYRNLALKALGYDIAKGDVRAEEAVSFVDKEFDSILRRWDPSKGKLSTHITANISPKRQAFYESQIGKKAKTTSIDDERAQQVADTEQTVEFDEKEKQDTGRQKIYSSETDQVQDQDVSETKALIKDELKKDILLAINKGQNVADVVATIKNNAKKSYFKQLRKDIGTFSSDTYKAFVSSLDAKFIKSLPIAAIKRRFGKLFSIKQIGTTPTKQISKTGKPSYFNKPIYNVPKINSEGLQNFKDYFLGGEKRQQSLYNLLASDFALESINELMNDADFMSKLQTALDNDGITAQEFMQSIENKLDPRAVEDKSLDVVQKASKDGKAKFINIAEGNYDNVVKKIKSKLKSIKGVPLKEGTLDEAKGQYAVKNKPVAMYDWDAKIDPKNKNSLTYGEARNNLVSRLIESVPKKFQPMMRQLIKDASTNQLAVGNVKEGGDVKGARVGNLALYGNEAEFDKNVKDYGQGETITRDSILSKGGILTDKLFDKLKSEKFNKKQDQKLDILDMLIDALTSISKDPNASWFTKTFLASATNKQGHPLRFLFPVRNVETDINGKPYNKPYREEHGFVANNAGSLIEYGVMTGQTDVVKKILRASAQQTLLTRDTDAKLGKAKLGTSMGANFSELIKGVLDGTINPKMEGVISLSRYLSDGLVNINNLYNLQQNLMMPKALGMKISLKSSPNLDALIETLSNELIESPNSLNKINKLIKVQEKLIPAKNKQSKALTKQYAPKLPENVTTEKKVEILNNYDTTVALASKSSIKPKGISVFDFDDTLAKTKEKVIVNMPDGKSKEISAAKFAEQAGELQDAGATFNFDNFENVGKGTQKGPLADLALKRQGKFGSKDIFVLTARPQIAATGIKTFLDGIGLNIPLENITGLENGSPQAKADWVISKTAEGYNDFYFADDAIGNVKAVKEILDQVDVKSDVQLARASKGVTFDKIMNNILEDSTGIKSEAEFSKARAQTVGAKKGRFSFFTTPSAEDFVGLIYRFLGKGKVGNAQFQFFQDNLIDPYNRAEQAVTRAKISAANDFKALKNSLKTLPKSLSKKTGIGGFTFGQAARVAVWTRQDMEIPGLSKRDAKELNDFVNNNAELDVFADELINIQKGKPYPKPSQTWLAGNITSDIVNEINKVNRKEYMQEFNENLDIIFSDKVMNKLEATYGPRYVEALRDMFRRMKSGSNRPVGNSRIVDGLLNWLNNSVGAIMFLNTRSAVLQTISAVNFINFGNNNLIAAGKAFANQKQYWKDFMTLFNSPYLVERRDGLKINVSESEIADAVSESSNKPKAFLNLLLSKGFVLTRFADSFAIAAGGSTFYRNQVKAYVKSGMDQKAAEKQAFDDFYTVAETSQQSSNPSKISQQQASGAGRVILAFANTPMQYARIIKRSSQDLAAGRGDWKTNVSKIVYYGAMQNLIFNALQTALFSLAFGEEDEEKEDKTGRIANGMADSLLRGLGIQGAAVAAVKDALITIYKQANKEKGTPEFRKAINDLFGFSPPLDSKIRKLNSGLNTLSWEREKMSQEGFNLNNPAYLAFAQVLAGLTNVPLDRAIQKINNLRAATSDSSAKWQKVALLMGWSTWDLGLPYYGVEDKEVQTPQTILRDKVNKMKKETSTKEQKEILLELGLTKQQIKDLKYENERIKKIIELQK